MASLASINRQLYRVESQISGLNGTVEEKEEKIRRLKDAQSELISVKHDFLGDEESCLEPEFSEKTFHGNNSNNYHTYRKMQLQKSFREIPVTQMMGAMAKMQEVINELNEEIDGLMDNISDLKDRQDSLKEQRELEKQSSSGGNK